MSSSFDGHSPFNSLKYFTFDYRQQSFSMQLYSQAYSKTDACSSVHLLFATQ